MKSLEAEEGIGLSESEARKFLSESKSTLLLGTINTDGTPVIHPVWFYFDSERSKLYVYTGATSKKARNIRRQADVYFDVDDDHWPYKGVKGKGHARIVTEKQMGLAQTKRILAKYLKKDHPMIDATLQEIRSGGRVLIEITPAYFSSWDYAKLKPRTRKDLRNAVYTEESEPRAGDAIVVVRPDELAKGGATRGIIRNVAFETENVHFSHSRIAGGNISGWHHHGEKEVYGFILSGRLLFDFGEGGKGHAETKAGDFFHIPVGLVHRDKNPNRAEVLVINIFLGKGPQAVNVTGPPSRRLRNRQ
jgi:PPOX class probable F420-dependent enzyme